MDREPAEARPRARRWLRRAAWALGLPLALAVVIGAGHAWMARDFPDLRPWHRIVPAGEPDAAQMDAGMDLDGYLAREEVLFAELRMQLADTLPPADAVPGNRYGSVHGHAKAGVDWNRSFERIPPQPRGAALLVHGLTDGPYSQRTLADRLHVQGWHVLVLRLPGHGTVPAALRDVRWEDLAAAVRLGLRHLRAAHPDLPLVGVGYSTGAALLLHHELQAIDDAAQPRIERLVLLSPLVGLGRGAGLAPLLSLFDAVPGLEKAAWLEVQPEYNPFKYNSFPVNGAWQSYRLVGSLVAGLERLRATGRLDALPPMMTFHSVLDSTVLSAAVESELYDRLPPNGSELVLYDLNRWTVFAPLFRGDQLDAAQRLLRGGPHPYTLRVLTNVSPATREVHELALPAGGREPAARALGLSFPEAVYSLSHTAIPFACDDPLYGLAPRADEDYGVRLGTLALRGERHALQVSMDQLARLNCNPFFDDLAARVVDWVGAAR